MEVTLIETLNGIARAIRVCGIGNYLIWWLTTITGGITFCILGILYCSGWVLYYILFVCVNLLLAPIKDKNISLYNIEEDNLPAWADKTFKGIWSYMGSRPF